MPLQHDMDEILKKAGDGIMTTLSIPAGGSVQTNFYPPLIQNAVAQTWTVDLPDVTGTTCTFSALFAKNV